MTNYDKKKLKRINFKYPQILDYFYKFPMTFPDLNCQANIFTNYQAFLFFYFWEITNYQANLKIWIRNNSRSRIYQFDLSSLTYIQLALFRKLQKNELHEHGHEFCLPFLFCFTIKQLVAGIKEIKHNNILGKNRYYIAIRPLNPHYSHHLPVKYQN